MFKFYKTVTAMALAAAILSACATDGKQAAETPLTAEESQAYAAAIQHYETLSTERPDEIEAILGLARNLRWAGRVNDAEQVLTLRRNRFGDDGRYLAELGKIRLVQGDSATGVALLQRAAEMTPDDWRMHSAIGIGLDLQLDHRGAQAAYARALEMCPDDAAVMNNLGISQGLSGQLDRAILTFQDALKLGMHTDKIQRNLDLFKNVRDLCPTCGARFFQSSRSTILAAGLMGTDREGPCTPEPAYTETANVMAEQLAPEVEAPTINIKVYFEFDSAILKPEAMAVLDNLGEALNSGELATYRFQIAGHTDAVGGEAYNQDLSERRAQAVVDFLAEQFAIDPERIDAVGFGESRLLDPDDPEGDINRRVQVTRLEPLEPM